MLYIYQFFNNLYFEMDFYAIVFFVLDILREIHNN